MLKYFKLHNIEDSNTLDLLISTIETLVNALKTLEVDERAKLLGLNNTDLKGIATTRQVSNIVIMNS